MFGFESDLEVEAMGRENGGNYTCTVENDFGSDRVTYDVMVQGGERLRNLPALVHWHL